MELPVEFCERMKTLLKGDYPAFAASFDRAPTRAMLINTAKISEGEFDALRDFDAEQVSYANAARRLLCDVKMGGHPMHVAGLMYMQDAGAMATCAAVGDFGKLVLDLCAAPGGKTVAAALAVKDGLVVANEVNFARCKTLISNVERLGLKNVAITSLPVTEFAKRTPAVFDTVIVDAPCSGEGMFRKEPRAVEEWNTGLAESLAARQKEILTSAYAALKEGGTLLYSTCTYSVEENEKVVAWLLHNYDLTLVAPAEPLLQVTAPGVDVGEDTACMRRFYPHIAEGEGQFFAVLKKGGVPKLNVLPAVPSNITVNEAKRIRSFTDGLSACDFGDIMKQGDNYFAVSPLSNKLNLHYVRQGVCLGEWVANRFNPHHNLFTAWGDGFVNAEDMPLSDSRVADYLRGLEIDAVTARDGWCAVRINGHTLGGGKVVQGKIKNHFPKGLRTF